ncbi:hypothetical protein BSKO_02180 [Bryopsis sp. KO-2023]|nr:hypothetical protein BSKO_02180 [Bryopsis sp. KO-2023]
MFRQLRFIFNELRNFGKPEVEALEKQALELRTQLEELKQLKQSREQFTQDATRQLLRGALEAMRSVEARKEVQEEKMREIFSSLEKELSEEVMDKVMQGSMEDMEAVIKSALAGMEGTGLTSGGNENSLPEFEGNFDRLTTEKMAGEITDSGSKDSEPLDEPAKNSPSK